MVSQGSGSYELGSPSSKTNIEPRPSPVRLPTQPQISLGICSPPRTDLWSVEPSDPGTVLRPPRDQNWCPLVSSFSLGLTKSTRGRYDSLSRVPSSTRRTVRVKRGLLPRRRGTRLRTRVDRTPDRKYVDGPTRVLVGTPSGPDPSVGRWNPTLSLDVSHSLTRVVSRPRSRPWE